MWDPVLYGRYATERSRPFFDLVARIDADQPALVVDLGCGSGELTASLASRWPAADVRGIDSSAEMIESAQKMLATRPGGSGPGAGRLGFALDDVRTWRPARPADVLVSNAVLQWVPEHRDLLARWADGLAAGGWLAFQLPGNGEAPAYQVLRELIGSAAWRSRLADLDLNQQGADPAEYLDLLARAGCDVDAWETTYLHILQGEDPVLRWYLSTGLRPVVAALDPEAAERFLAEYGALLRGAYPAAAYGTLFPFRRVFVVARRR
ncbi:MAG TPA: trans-aconitate 2-methyltransferase [Streptosporangiaceae bacterium]|nr:trans-aconitate 2-methyltransferase [Streptosporangiaceae bacterium]